LQITARFPRFLLPTATARCLLPHAYLGIDPGLRLTGYGVIDYKSLRPSLVDGGVIRLKTKTTIADRLVELETELQSPV